MELCDTNVMETPQEQQAGPASAMLAKQAQPRARGSITATASLDFSGLSTSSPAVQAAQACASALVLGKIRNGVTAAGEVLDMASIASSTSSGGRSSRRSGRASTSSQHRRRGRGVRDLGAVCAELAFAQDLSPAAPSPAAAGTSPDAVPLSLSALVDEADAPVPAETADEEPEVGSGASGDEDGTTEEDSVALARRLMQEESMLVYRELQQATVQMALASMQGGGVDDMDEDTRLSLQLMQAEVQQMHGTSEEGMAALAQASAVAASAEQEEEGGTNAEMDYDALLQLGEALGDVQTERWQARAASVIETLPVGAWSGKGECMCAICRCDFDEDDEDDEVMKLPCSHEFHKDCAVQWLKDHPSCPYCKTGIEPGSPVKQAAAPSPAPEASAPAEASPAPAPAPAAAATPEVTMAGARKRAALSPMSDE